MDTQHPDPSPPGANRPAGDSAPRRELERIEAEVAALFFQLVEARRRKTGLGGKRPHRARVELSLDLQAPGPAPTPSGQLFHQLERAADEVADKSASFPLGRVYCHWCCSFSCQHSFPAEPRSVFGGYTATGQPRWPQLAAVLLERRDPRVEQIYGERPSPLSLLQNGDELANDLLPVYGKRSTVYPILAQLAFGYLEPPRPAESNGNGNGNGASRSLFCVTFQAVEVASGSSSLLLNVLGRLEDGSSALEALEAASDPRLADALLSTRRRLAEIGLVRLPRRRRLQGRRQRALDALHYLGRNLERIFRQRQRRTRHSEERHQHRGRPSSTALRDALNAPVDAIYRDVEERTWVVLGPRSRVHIFNDAGAHVTSVVYPGETVRYRTTRGKWLTPRADEIESFRDVVARRGGGR